METLLAIVIGVLFGTGLFLMMQRVLVKILIGLALISNGANFLIFVSAGLTRGRPPVVPEGEKVPLEATADPLAQALILTAIVIGFGVLAFSLALARATYRATGTDDIDEMRGSDLDT